MKHEEIVAFIEHSFLKNLLSKNSITDISYNGNDIFYVDNKLGRKKSDIKINGETAKDFIRQVSNLCEKQFSFQSPKLDVCVGKYRINAIHQSIGKRNNEDVVEFSIRIASEKPRIVSGSSYFEPLVEELLNVLIKSNVSMVIGGITGSGKTELQKFLITSMSEHTRVIVIDNILELDSLSEINHLDFNVWQADDKNPNASIQELVKTALRSNPDWLIVAESRGEEMIDVLNSSLTGHPIITTIHAFDLETMPIRMARMAMMASKNLQLKETLEDLSYHLRFYIYVKKEKQKNGSITRYIDSIGYLNNGKMEVIYSFKNKKSKYNKLPKSALKFLNLSNVTKKFKDTFLGDEQ